MPAILDFPSGTDWINFGGCIYFRLRVTFTPALPLQIQPCMLDQARYRCYLLVSRLFDSCILWADLKLVPDQLAIILDEIAAAKQIVKPLISNFSALLDYFKLFLLKFIPSSIVTFRFLTCTLQSFVDVVLATLQVAVQRTATRDFNFVPEVTVSKLFVVLETM